MSLGRQEHQAAMAEAAVALADKIGGTEEEMLAPCALHRSEDGRWRAHWDRRARPYTREPKSRQDG